MIYHTSETFTLSWTFWYKNACGIFQDKFVRHNKRSYDIKMYRKELFFAHLKIRKVIFWVCTFFLSWTAIIEKWQEGSTIGLPDNVTNRYRWPKPKRLFSDRNGRRRRRRKRTRRRRREKKRMRKFLMTDFNWKCHWIK